MFVNIIIIDDSVNQKHFLGLELQSLGVIKRCRKHFYITWTDCTPLSLTTSVKPHVNQLFVASL